MKYIKEKTPILLSLFATALFFCILSFSGLIIEHIPWALNGSEYRYQLCGEIIAASFSLGTMLLFSNFYVFKRKGDGFFKGLIPCLYIIITVCYSGILQFINSVNLEYTLASFGDITVFLLTMVMVGVTEELLFRGFIAEIIFEKYGKTGAGVWFSVIVSGCIFGFMHIINAVSIGNGASALIQSIVASVIGMAFCAIYYRTKNLYVCIFLHIIINTASLTPTGIFEGYSFGEALSSYTSFNLIAAIPYFILTLILLRPEKMKTVAKTPLPSERKMIIINTLLGTALFMVAIITAYVLLPESLETMAELMKEAA